MTLITYRVDIHYIPEDIDFKEFVQPLGDEQFLVKHLKKDNFHYHGCFNSKYCAKTIRNKFKALLGAQGNKAYSVSDNVDNLNKYKAYCLYRPGHPIQEIIVNEDIEQLKIIHQENKPKDNIKELKMERMLKDILEQVEDTTVMGIGRTVCQYFRKTGKVFHKANILQLIWTIKSIKSDNDDDFLKSVFQDDETLLREHLSELDTKTYTNMYRYKMPEPRYDEGERSEQCDRYSTPEVG